jgi:hypothetical protein
MDIVSSLTGFDGTAGYFGPLTKYLKDPHHEDIVKNKMCIHAVLPQRSASDPTEIKLDPPRGPKNYRPRCHNLLSLVSPEKAAQNTKRAREQLCRQVMKINNHDNMQRHEHGSKYQANPSNILEYGGDLTPSDPQMAPPLSDFFTIRDTMDIICSTHCTESGEACSPSDILGNDEILTLCFRTNLIPEVKRFFSPEGGDASGIIPEDIEFDSIPFGE